MSDTDTDQESALPATQPEEEKATPPSQDVRTELAVAANYLTRFEFAAPDPLEASTIKASVCWFPIIGALIGFAGASVDWIMTQIGLPGLLTSSFAIISMLWLTRALHEEDFANLANLYGKKFDKNDSKGWAKEDRSIQYGTLAIISIMLLKIGAIASMDMSEVVFSSLIVAGALSRAAMSVVMAGLPPLDKDSTAAFFGTPSFPRIILGVFFASLITLFGFGDISLSLLLVAALFTALLFFFGKTKIRGYNGPLLGAVQEITELAVLGTVLIFQ